MRHLIQSLCEKLSLQLYDIILHLPFGKIKIKKGILQKDIEKGFAHKMYKFSIVYTDSHHSYHKL